MRHYIWGVESLMNDETGVSISGIAELLRSTVTRCKSNR